MYYVYFIFNFKLYFGQPFNGNINIEYGKEIHAFKHSFCVGFPWYHNLKKYKE